MKFSVSKEVFKLFENFSVGILVCENIRFEHSEELKKLISEVSELINTNFTPDSIVEHKLISPWKSAFFDFEEKPKETHSSVERLTKEVMKTGELETKNTPEDICNYISLKYIVPVECFDLSKITGAITLKRAEGDEHFESKPEKGELIYTDKIKVLARKLDYVEDKNVNVNKKSEKIIIMVEGLKPLLKKDIKDITTETADLFKTFCNTEAKQFIVDKDNSEIEF